MRVLVMGSGAIGGYYGGLLARRGHDVAFVARGAHLAAMQERGLEIRSGEGTIALRPVRAVAPRAEAIADALRDAGVEVTVSADPRAAVWSKLVMLAPHATLTSASQTPVGPIRETPEGLALYRQLVAEAVAVGRAEGVALAPDAEEAAMDAITSFPPGTKTSLQVDFERQNRVELEQLTGAVVRRGRQ